MSTRPDCACVPSIRHMPSQNLQPPELIRPMHMSLIVPSRMLLWPIRDGGTRHDYDGQNNNHAFSRDAYGRSARLLHNFLHFFVSRRFTRDAGAEHGADTITARG